MKYTARQFYDHFSEEDENVIDLWLTTFYKYDSDFKEVDEWMDLPLACPWLWENRDEIILHGTDVEDMVYNFCSDQDIYKLIREAKKTPINKECWYE